MCAPTIGGKSLAGPRRAHAARVDVLATVGGAQQLTPPTDAVPVVMILGG